MYSYYNRPLTKWSTAQLKARIIDDSKDRERLLKELIIRVRKEEQEKQLVNR